MNADDLIAALALPDGARVERRVPKKLLIENGAPTAADKRQINDGVESLRWLAALKPAATGAAPYRDDTREILEIAVLRAMLRPGAKWSRLIELMHRAIPYPVVLVAEDPQRLTLSLAHKRWSQAERDQVVLDGEVIEVDVSGDVSSDVVEAFCAALSLAKQPRTTMLALYQGWVDTANASLAARLTGRFTLPTSAEHAVIRREALRTCREIESRMLGLRAAAEKEDQLPRRVELNLELQRLRADYETASSEL